MDTLTYWDLADSLAFRCRPEDVGTLRPAEATQVPEGATERQRLALALAPRAMRALGRLMDGEGRTALEAARLVLAYAYPEPPEPPPSPAPASVPPDTGALPPPPWLDPERLSYQADDCLGRHRGLNN